MGFRKKKQVIKYNISVMKKVYITLKKWGSACVDIKPVYMQPLAYNSRNLKPTANSTHGMSKQREL